MFLTYILIAPVVLFFKSQPFSLDCDGFTGIYLSLKIQLTKLYTLNAYSFLYVNHSSMKGFLKMPISAKNKVTQAEEVMT